MFETKGSLLHQLVYKDILGKIKNGEYKIGDILPSEKQLQEVYNVSRITVRRAMTELQNQGFVEKFPGTGTIVKADRTVLNLNRINSFSEENIHSNTFSKLVNFEIVKPDKRIKSKLNLKGNTETYKVERVRLINDLAVGFHSAYIPRNIIELSKEDFLDYDSSLYEMFEMENIILKNAIESIEAKLSDEKLEEYLELTLGYPILYKERTSYDVLDRAVEFVEISYRADQYKYQIELENF